MASILPSKSVSEEIIRRGQALYERHIRSEVEPENRGKYLIINVESGEYVMDADDLVASKRARERFPDAPLFTMRIGEAAAYHIGSVVQRKENNGR